MAVLLVNVPTYDSGGFRGAPTSLLYACAPLTTRIRAQCRGNVASGGGIISYDPGSWQEYLSELPDLCCDPSIGLVGLSATSHSHWLAIQGARMVRRLNPDAVVILGGPHEDEACRSLGAAGHSLARWPGCVDAVVAGEAEFVLKWACDLVGDVPGNSGHAAKVATLLRHAPKIAGMPGRVFLDIGDAEGGYHRFASRGAPLALDALPLANRTFLAPRHYLDYQVFTHPSGQTKRTVQVTTHRGCRGRCSYCSERMGYRERSPNRILEEIAEMVGDFGFEAVFFDDSTFNDYAPAELLTGLKELSIEWGCLSRFDRVDYRVLTEMRNSGCTYIYFGLEQFDEGVLRRAGKHIAPVTTEDVVRMCRQMAIRVGVSCLFGMGETMPVARRTLEQVGRWASEGSLSVVSLSALCYHPGAPISKQRDTWQLLDYDRFPPHHGSPWDCFEEGLWHHPRSFSEAYAAWIRGVAQKLIPREVLVRHAEIFDSKEARASRDALASHAAALIAGTAPEQALATAQDRRFVASPSPTFAGASRRSRRVGNLQVIGSDTQQRGRRPPEI